MLREEKNKNLLIDKTSQQFIYMLHTLLFYTKSSGKNSR